MHKAGDTHDTCQRQERQIIEAVVTGEVRKGASPDHRDGAGALEVALSPGIVRPPTATAWVDPRNERQCVRVDRMLVRQA